ncbi:MAG: alpha/beta hydrolase fold domain-containing protein [Lentimonas sp.]
MNAKQSRTPLYIITLLSASLCLPVTAKGDSNSGPLKEHVSSAHSSEVNVYTFRSEKVNGKTGEIEIHFPKRHDASEAKRPAVIMFHGGGWGSGSRKQFTPFCEYLASRGLVAATVTYALAKKSTTPGISRKRVCIEDAKSAIRWYKQHADELGIDPQRIIAGGGSAGGHISLLATTNSGLNKPNDPKGYDTDVLAYLLFNPALGVEDSKDSEVNFLKHLKADLPPSITFFGSEDKKWFTGWKKATKKMQSLKVQSAELYIAEGQGHGFFNKKPWSDLTFIEADRFLKKHGLVTGKPTLAAPKSGQTLVRK